MRQAGNNAHLTGRGYHPPGPVLRKTSPRGTKPRASENPHFVHFFHFVHLDTLLNLRDAKKIDNVNEHSTEVRNVRNERHERNLRFRMLREGGPAQRGRHVDWGPSYNLAKPVKYESGPQRGRDSKSQKFDNFSTLREFQTS